ncbi:dienelactone hydrolase family protein [Sphingomonas sp.]|uniref:dienelactone hydrolase family protein n=1 Tax=Sphingomonas sp. TaxID=28214 RepID=UPI0025E67B27|nr:dienelactone hydrolase family protein [Sphingomonas sp.]
MDGQARQVENSFLPVDDGRIGLTGIVQDRAGGDEPGPAVILLHEIFGVNFAMREELVRLAGAGYLAVAPDLFHRQAPGVQLSYDPQERPMALALWQAFDTDQAVQDIEKVRAHVAADPRCDGRVAVVGFCLGGKLALLAGGRGGFAAVISYYPVQMSDFPDALDSLSTPTVIHMGDNDVHVGPAAVSHLIEAAARNDSVDFRLYPGAAHAFANRHRLEEFDAVATTQSWERNFALLDQSMSR